MKFNPYNTRTRSMRDDLTVLLCNTECVMHQATIKRWVKSLSYYTGAHCGPRHQDYSGTAQLFMVWVLPAHIVNKAADDVTGTFIENDFDATEHKLELLSSPVVKLSSDKKSEIERVLTGLNLMTKTDVEMIVENSLTRWTTTLQSYIVKTVEFAFERTSQASLLDSNNGLKSIMFTVIEVVLGLVIRSGRALMVSQAQKCSTARTRVLDDRNLQAVVFSTGHIVLIAEIGWQAGGQSSRRNVLTGCRERFEDRMRNWAIYSTCAAPFKEDVEHSAWLRFARGQPL